MTTAIAERATDALVVTPDQFDLIRRTIAKDASPDELKLYLYDCRRQGVHPLDKLVHFTKRAGKYTPITSIDFMRIRAAETNEYAGSDDAEFDPCPNAGTGNGTPQWARVTVWRLVQGQRCSFTATARWTEYKPEANDFMWRKMPHTMLAKCAEALALRKGFPRQLAGLYAREEMDQAGPETGYVVEAPAPRTAIPPAGERENPSVPNGGDMSGVDSGASRVPATGSRTDEGPDLGVDLPAGARLILKVLPGKAGAKAEIFFNAPCPQSQRDALLTYKEQLADLARELCQLREPCLVGEKKSTAGNWRVEDLMRVPKHYDDAHEPDHVMPVKTEDIPF